MSWQDCTFHRFPSQGGPEDPCDPDLIFLLTLDTFADLRCRHVTIWEHFEAPIRGHIHKYVCGTLLHPS